MNLLLLGGTIFVGRHLAEAARRNGHSVTVFHRGKHSPGLFAGDSGITTILGDRTAPDDLARLASSGKWDAVVDTCGYLPRFVELSATHLCKVSPHYCFISSASVYADWGAQTPPETAPLATLPGPATEEITGETYGRLKVLCEAAAVIAAFRAVNLE